MAKRPRKFDPEGVSNEDRAEWAQAGVDAFQETTKSDDEDVIADLLGDLMHLCAREHKQYGTFAECLERGRAFFNFENNESDEPAAPKKLPKPKKGEKVYTVTANRTTVYEVNATDEESAIDLMMEGAALEVHGETHSMKATEGAAE